MFTSRKALYNAMYTVTSKYRALYKVDMMILRVKQAFRLCSEILANKILALDDIFFYDECNGILQIFYAD